MSIYLSVSNLADKSQLDSFLTKLPNNHDVFQWNGQVLSKRSVPVKAIVFFDANNHKKDKNDKNTIKSIIGMGQYHDAKYAEDKRLPMYVYKDGYLYEVTKFTSYADKTDYKKIAVLRFNECRPLHILNVFPSRKNVWVTSKTEEIINPSAGNNRTAPEQIQTTFISSNNFKFGNDAFYHSDKTITFNNSRRRLLLIP